MNVRCDVCKQEKQANQVQQCPQCKKALCDNCRGGASQCQASKNGKAGCSGYFKRVE
jgi:hypothetical protein